LELAVGERKTVLVSIRGEISTDDHAGRGNGCSLSVDDACQGKVKGDKIKPSCSYLVITDLCLCSKAPTTSKATAKIFFMQILRFLS
jgi:hypothetical protein